MNLTDIEELQNTAIRERELMSALTSNDLPLLQSAGAEVSFTGTAHWLKDNSGQEWYVRESDNNQYLEFQTVNGLRLGDVHTMTREEFEERFR